MAAAVLTCQKELPNFEIMPDHRQSVGATYFNVPLFLSIFANAFRFRYSSVKRRANPSAIRFGISDASVLREQSGNNKSSLLCFIVIFCSWERP